jgi:hypothetical protein
MDGRYVQETPVFNNSNLDPRKSTNLCLQQASMFPLRVKKRSVEKECRERERQRKQTREKKRGEGERER